MQSTPPGRATLDDILDHIQDGVFALDDEGRFVFVNSAAEKILRHDRESLLGKKIWEIFPQAVGGRSFLEYQRLTAERRAVEYEEFFPGLGRWIEVRVWPTEGRITASFRDVSERRALHARLERSEARFRALMSATRQAVWVTDPEGRVIEDIPAWRAFTGLASEELLGFGWVSAVHPEDRAPTLDAWKAAITRAAVFEARHRLRRHDGVYRHMSVRAVAMRDDAGAVIEWVGVSTDVTEQLQADQEERERASLLARAQKLESLGVLAGGIAHDVNNLLVGILGNASVALTEAEPTSPVAEPLTEIVTTAQRAAGLAHQLLAYSGKGRFALAPLDVSALLREDQVLLQAAISRSATLRLDAPPGLPRIEADSAQIRQVILNLITNASDALGAAKGVVTVQSGVVRATQARLRSTFVDDDLPEGDYVFVEVADTGMGMTPETAARMFDPFFTTKRSGHGLGLAAALGIVRGHRGAIEVATDPGHGSRVTALFPAMKSEEIPAAPRPTTSAPPGGKILVVDDDDMVRRVAKRMLVKAGYEVLEAEHGKAALVVFEAHRGEIALVLLDLSMPVMGGEETYAALRALDPGLPIVLSSGYNEDDATSHFVGSGLAGFVQKPFIMSDLLAMVQQMKRG